MEPTASPATPASPSPPQSTQSSPRGDGGRCMDHRGFNGITANGDNLGRLNGVISCIVNKMINTNKMDVNREIMYLFC